MKYILILILLLTSFNVFAIDVEPIKKGTPAPTDGFFVNAENMKKIRKINEEKKHLELKHLKLKDLQIQTERRLDFEKQYSSNLSKQLTKEQISGTFKGIGGFLLGTFLTGLVSYATIKTLR